tara:strand:- start:236796 stop:236897 length:102 start_codon:yes stop_codon:yes gene_type:complete
MKVMDINQQQKKVVLSASNVPITAAGEKVFGVI